MGFGVGGAVAGSVWRFRARSAMRASRCSRRCRTKATDSAVRHSGEPQLVRLDGVPHQVQVRSVMSSCFHQVGHAPGTVAAVAGGLCVRFVVSLFRATDNGSSRRGGSVTRRMFWASVPCSVVVVVPKVKRSGNRVAAAPACERLACGHAGGVVGAECAVSGVVAAGGRRASLAFLGAAVGGASVAGGDERGAVEADPQRVLLWCGASARG